MYHRESKMTTLAVSNDASPYRWYLCVQETSMKWNCARVNEKTALYPFCEFDYKAEAQLPNSKAIPISKWQPKVFDSLILHSRLHPTIRLSM